MQNYCNTDPPTSALARRELENTGTAARHRQLCLKIVTRSPGLTAREVEDRIDIKAHKRLPELRAAGLVHNGKTRHCSISNRLAMTWHPGKGGQDDE
ncbi:MAG: winged helix-turn-helix domain-containing protein [Phycisphaerae bacterium]|nr:winged helix-turn-helix domain-containing protein [Phycisphaerae bacterium]